MSKLGLWKSDQKIILASTSNTRCALLESAGLQFEAIPSQVDEREIARPLVNSHASGQEVALMLARAKALAVAARKPGRTVLGGDQTLSIGDRIFSKPLSKLEAARHLKALSGREHQLHSAISVVKDKTVLFETVECARLTTRVLSDDFIDAYLEAVGEVVQQSVGCYQVEALGIHLFESVEGDHSTILGLPLIPLLKFLRSSHMIAA